MKRRIAILGSTGSIGTQALDVIRSHHDKFVTEVLVANNNAELLIQQAHEFHPHIVIIANEDKYEMVQHALQNSDTKVYAGNDAINQVVEMETIDIILTAMVGFAGLAPTIRAVKKGKTIALANKETMVVAGELIQELAFDHHAQIYPVDSEHSAIFQCLTGEMYNPIEKIYLTASGGPFRDKSVEELAEVTRHEALKHPNWEMGNKITIDSASLMNKGLEVIEARWLFEVAPDQIEVVIHPQSIIHSMVQFEDGSMKAQMGLPDMKLPIQYAFSSPKRLYSKFPRFNFMDHPNLTFERPNTSAFRNLSLAYEAMHQGGNMPCILNAANEIVVDAFLKDQITFLQMTDIIEKTMQKASYIKTPAYECYIQSNQEARQIAQAFTSTI